MPRSLRLKPQVPLEPLWPPRYIHKVGVELEGGWLDDSQPQGMHGDGSVTVVAPWVGEISSPAMLPHELPPWIAKNYCDIINASCGFHIHVSTRHHGDYARLMQEEFSTFLLSQFEAWGNKLKRLREYQPFWQRLAGENDFCQKTFIPEQQWHARSRSYERYTQLNYCHGVHGTLELRLLPMFPDVRDAISATKLFLSCANGYIAHSRLANKLVQRYNLSMDLQEATT